jgi:hypothetical protein
MKLFAQALMKFKIGEENMERFMIGVNNGSLLKRLETHSIVMMLMLAVWNEELCCVPLHTLNGFEEFLSSSHWR